MATATSLPAVQADEAAEHHNASTMTHEELDAMEVLDEGDRSLLMSSTGQRLQQPPSIATLGGCRGTDATHVASLRGVPAQDS